VPHTWRTTVSDKLKEMEALFWAEAQKYQVLPLEPTVATRLVAPRPIERGAFGVHVLGRAHGIPNGDAPSILNSSYNFKAEVEIPQGGGDGMIVTQGGASADRVLYP